MNQLKSQKINSKQLKLIIKLKIQNYLMIRSKRH